MASFWSYTGANGKDRALVPVLKLENLYSYTIPSVAVLTVEMRRMKYQCMLPDGTTQIVDGFIREDPSVQRHTYPAELSVEISTTKACTVEVCES